MKRNLVFAIFALFLLMSCSGGIETVTLSDSGSGLPTDTAQSTDSTSPTDTALPTDAIPPTKSAPSTDADSQPVERELEIITLLPKDGIPAIDNPVFISAGEADSQYEPDELVIGVQFDGDARAYSIPMLSSHEIVNDTVGGRKIAVTW